MVVQNSDADVRRQSRYFGLHFASLASEFSDTILRCSVICTYLVLSETTVKRTYRYSIMMYDCSFVPWIVENLRTDSNSSGGIFCQYHRRWYCTRTRKIYCIRYVGEGLLLSVIAYCFLRAPSLCRTVTGANHLTGRAQFPVNSFLTNNN
jgi:hypothetical protein